MYSRYDYLIGTSSAIVAIVATLIKCAYAISEAKHLKEEARVYKIELDRQTKHVREVEAKRTSKEAEDLNKLVELLGKIPVKKEKEPITIRPREIPIEKVREMMSQYGLTVDDFRRDFPDAIII